MMKTKKILFTDLDGTLLDSTKKVSKSDFDSIEQIIKEGHRFVFVTGRPLFSVMKIAKEFGFIRDGFYIAAFNGAQVYDPYNEKMIFEHLMPYEYCDFLFEKGRSEDLTLVTYTDTNVIVEKETEDALFYSNRIKMPLIVSPDYRDALSHEPAKVLAINRNSREPLERFRKMVAPFKDGRLNSVFSCPFLLEYALPEATKGNAVKFFCDYFDIPIENAIACGDEENDITMLDAAGIGVAMKNGTDQVKAHADYITKSSNDESGITEVINNLILECKDIFRQEA